MHYSRTVLAPSLSLLLFLSSCGSDPVGPGDAVVRQIVGPEGGIVESGDGHLTLAFPPGAVAEATEIVCFPASTDDIAGSSSYVAERAYDCRPEALQLRSRVRVRIHFDPGTVCDDCDRQRLRIRQRERQQGQQQWRDCEQNQLNLQQGWAEGWAERLGLFALVIAEG